MVTPVEQNHLPDSNSPNLYLSHPTRNEGIKIWINTPVSWKDSLTHPDYLQDSLVLTTVPLARDRGMTTWIPVDKNLPQHHRPTCESFLKRSLMNDANGEVEEVIVYGIGSVFCSLEYRRRALHDRSLPKRFASGTQMKPKVLAVYYTWISGKPTMQSSYGNPIIPTGTSIPRPYKPQSPL